MSFAASWSLHAGMVKYVSALALALAALSDVVKRASGINNRTTLAPHNLESEEKDTYNRGSMVV